MPWTSIPTAEITGKFSPGELAGLQAAAGTPGSSTVLVAILNKTINKWIDTIAAAGGLVAYDGTVPDQVRDHIVHMTVWKYVTNYPKLPVFQTEYRRNANIEAEKILSQIARKEFGNIVSPGAPGVDVTTGNWNSAPKLMMRMNPVPLPALQLAAVPTPIYSNPNAPSDSVPVNSPGIPLPPPGVQAIGRNAQVLVWWDVGLTAVTYNVYRGTLSNAETLLASGITGTNYLDTAVVNGTTYYYYVTSVNTAAESQASLETVATPTVTSLQ